MAQLQPRIRSPLSKNLSPSTFSRSPLSENLISPLKRSSIITPTLHDDESNDDMSIESVSEAGEENELFFSDYDIEDEEIERRYDEEEVFGDKSSSKLNRGVLKDKNLRIEVPLKNRRVTDCEIELRKIALKNSAPATERPHSTLSSKGSVYWDIEDIRTRSAPPLMEIGQEDNISLEIEKEMEKIEDEICRDQENMRSSSNLYKDEEIVESVKETKTMEDAKISEVCSDDLDCHSISGQYAWQSLLAYDACIRVCLYEWSKGSTEASEFLRDECRILRGAFGLHKFLLQPRGVRSTEENKNVKQECVGKIQLFIGSTTTSDEDYHIKSAPVVETLAYDLLLEAATRAQKFHPQNLRLNGSWKWLLSEFADYYGVSDSYTKLRYLSHVMNVATPTKTCLQLVHELLVPILMARSEKSLTRQEKSILMDCEIEIEKLMATVFENYKSLDENCPSGLADISCPVQDSASAALSPAVLVFSLLHDILSPEAQEILKHYLQTAATKRCRKHMVETDEYVSCNSECFLLDSVTNSTAYLKMKNLCLIISNEIEADIKITNERVLPSSIDLANIAAAVYSTQLYNRLRAFLSAVPPSCPMPHVNELLIAVSDFERNLDSWGISPIKGAVTAKELYHSYITTWIEERRCYLYEFCKSETAKACSEIQGLTSPFVDEVYELLNATLDEYDIIIRRWPEYAASLEKVVADVERAIIQGLEKQFSEVLSPLRESKVSALKYVQKLTKKGQSNLYSVPKELGVLLNSMKRVLDTLRSSIENRFKVWRSYLPEKEKRVLGEQLSEVTVQLRAKFRSYMQALVEKIAESTRMQSHTRMKNIMHDLKETTAEPDVRDRMQSLKNLLDNTIDHLHCVLSLDVFVLICRRIWDRLGQDVLRLLEDSKDNVTWHKGRRIAVSVLDEIFVTQMQSLLGKSLKEENMEAPESIMELRSMLL